MIKRFNAVRPDTTSRYGSELHYSALINLDDISLVESEYKYNKTVYVVTMKNGHTITVCGNITLDDFIVKED